MRPKEQIYETLMSGLAKMRRQGVDYIDLGLYETNPEKPKGGTFIDLLEGYPFENLSAQEQQLILGRKHYEKYVLADVNPRGNAVNGVVKIERRHVNKPHGIVLLPEEAVTPESPWNYHTRFFVMTGEDLKRFAEHVEKQGWIKELFEQSIQNGIQEYLSKTKELMQKAGVDHALERMEEREYSPFEQILVGLPEQFYNAAPKTNNEKEYRRALERIYYRKHSPLDLLLQDMQKQIIKARAKK